MLSITAVEHWRDCHASLWPPQRCSAFAPMPRRRAVMCTCQAHESLIWWRMREAVNCTSSASLDAHLLGLVHSWGQTFCHIQKLINLIKSVIKPLDSIIPQAPRPRSSWTALPAAWRTRCRRRPPTCQQMMMTRQQMVQPLAAAAAAAAAASLQRLETRMRTRAQAWCCTACRWAGAAGSRMPLEVSLAVSDKIIAAAPSWCA
jgi:hypothetical protein